MKLGHRSRVGLIGTCAVLVALIAIAFAVGGSGSSPKLASHSTSGVAPAGDYASADLAPVDGLGVGAPAPLVAPGLPQKSEASAPDLARTSASGGVASGGGSSGGDSANVTSSGSSIDATRIVKTGNLTIRVAKGSASVQSATQALTALATSQGGYVSSSNTSLDTKNPYGEVVLRIPVAHFQDAIAAAEELGQKVVSLTTSADDVTGKYVDLSARQHALERTRSTYLTILSRARTIGETLSVQQRIDDVQQQIDQLHGQLKLLSNQSSYSTLTVDVVAAGTNTFATVHHQRHGIDKAWHDSWSRFNRGVNAIVGSIGPIVFALLLIALLGLIGYGGYRGFTRATSGSKTAA